MERTGTLEPQDKLRTKEEEQGKLNAVGSSTAKKTKKTFCQEVC